MNCCDTFSVDCNQGRLCPARHRPADAIATFYAETEGVMPMATGCSTKALPDPKRQPLPVIDGPASIRPTLLWFAVLITSIALAGYSVLHAARLFN